MRLGITAESSGDAMLVCRVGDKVVFDAAEWTHDIVDDVRLWRGLGQNSFLDIHAATRQAKERGVRIFGHFKDGPGKLDALLYRNIFALFADEDEPPNVLVVSHDTDGETERREGFAQAAKDQEWGFVPVHAVAHPEHEAWLLAAFEPKCAVENEVLKRLKQELGFDPTHEADRLKSGDETAKTNAKRILAELCDHKEARERLLAKPLDALRERGEGSGLTAFLDDFRAAVAPHLGKRSA